MCAAFAAYLGNVTVKAVFKLPISLSIHTFSKHYVISRFSEKIGKIPVYSENLHWFLTEGLPLFPRHMSDTVVMIEREQLLLLRVGYFFWERGCISCAYSNISILFWCLSSCTQELGSGVISPIQLEMKTHETNVLLNIGGR